jgi:lipid A 4'-phosphatase
MIRIIYGQLRRFAGLHFHCWSGWFCLFCIASIFFTVFPQVDIWFSHLFYSDQGVFKANDWLFVKGVYHLTPWMGRGAFIFALCTLLLSILSPAKVSRRHWRRAAAVVSVVVLGIGLLVHTVLKDGMGRPRPRDLQTFMGVTAYVPVMVPSQFCQSNCSFVSGHAAVGFAVMSMGMLSVRRRRQFWLFTGMVAGSLIGLVRISQGGHFLSDVVFSMIAIWGAHLLIRAVWLRFRYWQFQKSNILGSELQRSL